METQRFGITRVVVRFVVPVVAAAALLAPSAQAYPVFDEGAGPARTSESTPNAPAPYSPASAPSAEPTFDWAALGAGTALALTLAAAGTAFVLRTRSRLAAV